MNDLSTDILFIYLSFGQGLLFSAGWNNKRGMGWILSALRPNPLLFTKETRSENKLKKRRRKHSERKENRKTVNALIEACEWSSENFIFGSHLYQYSRETREMATTLATRHVFSGLALSCDKRNPFLDHPHFSSAPSKFSTLRSLSFSFSLFHGVFSRGKYCNVKL